MINSSIGHY